MNKLIFTIIFATLYLNSFSQIAFGEDEQEEKAEYMFAVKLSPDPMGHLVQCALIKFNDKGKLEVKFVSQDTWAKQFTGYQLSSANPKRRNNMALEKGVYPMPVNMYELTEDQKEDWTTQRITSILNNMWRLRYSEYPYRQDPDLVAYRKAVRQERAIRDSLIGRKKNETSEESEEQVAGQKRLAQGEFDWTKTEVNFGGYSKQERTIANMTSKGWASNPASTALPSKKQMIILKKYGLVNEEYEKAEKIKKQNNEYYDKFMDFQAINDFIYGENLYRLMKDMLDKSWQNAYKNAIDEE